LGTRLSPVASVGSPLLVSRLVTTVGRALRNLLVTITPREFLAVQRIVSYPFATIVRHYGDSYFSTFIVFLRHMPIPLVLLPLSVRHKILGNNQVSNGPVLFWFSGRIPLITFHTLPLVKTHTLDLMNT
jgi:hypothetical protein